MKPINVEKLKVGDQIFAFDWSLQKWIKCEIIQVEKYLITMENLDEELKGITFYDTIDKFKNPNYYLMGG